MQRGFVHRRHDSAGLIPACIEPDEVR